jgi:hypothetical protein
MSNYEERRSTFVTTLAWVFIVLTGFASLIAVVQSFMLYFVFPLDEMRAQMSEAASEMPPAAVFMLAHFELLFSAFLVVSLAALVVSIGLLRRKNWARLAFIGLMVLGVVWNIAGLALQQTFMSQMPVPRGTPAEFQESFGSMMRVMSVFSVVFALAVSSVFGWIAWRLRSPGIVAEFNGPARAQSQG